jgi:aryl carrier-like protein
MTCHRRRGANSWTVHASRALAGLDSLAAVELAHWLQDRYGVNLTATTLLGDATVAELAAFLCSDSGSASTAAAGSAPVQILQVAPDPQAGPDGRGGQRCVSAIRAKGPLAPMQRALWFEHQVAPVGPAYALVRALRLDGSPAPLPNAVTNRSATSGTARITSRRQNERCRRRHRASTENR